jgi:hypothetical protein
MLCKSWHRQTEIALFTEVNLADAQGLCNMSIQPAAGCTARPVTHRNRHTDILQHVVLLDLLSCSSLQAVVFVAVCTGFVQHVVQPAAGCNVC